MSTLTQFFSGGGGGGDGGSFIGQTMFFGDVGPLLTMPNGQVWLRSGTGVSAASYPEAAASRALPAHEIARTAQATSAGTGVACAYGNRAMLTYGNTSVDYSDDAGATWSRNAHNGTAGNVEHAGALGPGGKAVVVGIASSVIRPAYSSDGTTWAAGTSFGSSTYTGVPVVTWWNDRFICAAQGSSTNNIYYSATGQTWTQASAHLFNALPQIDAGGLGVMITLAGRTAAFWSTDGATFSAVTLPVSADSTAGRPLVFDDCVYYIDGSDNWWKSTNFTSWELVPKVTINGAPIDCARPVPWSRVGGKIIVGASSAGVHRIAAIASDLSYEVHSVFSGTATFSATNRIFMCDDALMLAPSNSFIHRGATTLASPNAIGTPSAATIGANDGVQYIYQRIA